MLVLLVMLSHIQQQSNTHIHVYIYIHIMTIATTGFRKLINLFETIEQFFKSLVFTKLLNAFESLPNAFNSF